MSTSGVYSFSITRDDIIREAMLNIGKLGEGQVPTPEETVDCARKLNMMVKQWQGKADYAPGLKIWTRKRGHLFLRGDTNQYALSQLSPGWTTEDFDQTTVLTSVAAGSGIVAVTSTAGMAAGDWVGFQTVDGNIFWTHINTVASSTGLTLVDVFPSGASGGAMVIAYSNSATAPIVLEAAVLRDYNNQDTPLRIMTQPTYDALPSKGDPTNVSDPTAVLMETQLNNVTNLYLDCSGAQDVTKHIILTYMETVQDFVNPLDNPYFPQEWYLPLSWGLTMQIAPMFRSKVTPDMRQNFMEALTIAQKKDPEMSEAYFQPGAEV
jgi:hypothetical protein